MAKKDEIGIHGVFDSQLEAKEGMNVLHDEIFRDKIDELLKRKEEKLNVSVIGKQFDDEKNLYVLCQREYDDTYITWVSYYTGDEKSYTDFYRGNYDMTLDEGLKDLYRRLGKEKGNYTAKLEPNMFNHRLNVIAFLTIAENQTDKPTKFAIYENIISPDSEDNFYILVPSKEDDEKNNKVKLSNVLSKEKYEQLQDNYYDMYAPVELDVEKDLQIEPKEFVDAQENRQLRIKRNMELER